MKRDDAAEEIRQNIKKMSFLFEKANVSERKVRRILSRLDREDVKASYVTDVEKVIRELKPILVDFEKVIALLPEHIWSYYDMMGFDGLREQNMLKDVMKRFKESWSKLPVYRKDEYGKEKKVSKASGKQKTGQDGNQSPKS